MLRPVVKVLRSLLAAFVLLGGGAGVALAGTTCTSGGVAGFVDFGWTYQVRSGPDLYWNGGRAKAYCDLGDTSTIDFGMWGGDITASTYGSGASGSPFPNGALLPADQARIRLPLSVATDTQIPSTYTYVLAGSGCTGSSCSYTFVRGPTTYACTVGVPRGWVWDGTDWADTIAANLSLDPSFIVANTGPPTGCYILHAPPVWNEGYSGGYYTCATGSLISGYCASPSGGTYYMTGAGSMAGAVGRAFTLNFTKPGVTALAPTSVAASDYTFPDRVRVTVGVPADPTCTNVRTVIARDGSDIANIDNGVLASSTVVVYDDMAATPGLHTYAARNICYAGAASATSGTLSDTGAIGGTPLPPNSVVATDGAFTDRIRVTWNGPNQSTQCTSVSYTIIRDGADLSTDSSIPLTGGSGTYDDTGVGMGVHTYTVRANCAPSGTATSAPDTGYRLGTPTAVTGLAASDDTYTDRIRVTFTAPDQSSQCTSANYIIVRGGTDVFTVSTIPVTGGAGSYDDMAAPQGTQTYSVRAECTPGGQTASSGTDNGRKQPTSAPPVSIAASDYTALDRVSITVVTPAASYCTSASAIISRSGVDIATVPASLAGGTINYDDIGGPMGPQFYDARMLCNYGSGSNESTRLSDTGARRYPNATCSSIDTAQPSMLFSTGGLMLATGRNVLNAGQVRIRATGQPNGPGDATNYTGIQTGNDYYANISLNNHALGVPEYGTIDVELLVTGLNPGDTEFVCATTSFIVYQGCDPIVLSGPKGTGPIPGTITWNASPGGTGFTVEEANLSSGPWTQVGTLPAGSTSFPIPGWPKKWYKVSCTSPLPAGDTVSAPGQFWGNPGPIILPLTFSASNPGTTTVMASVADPDGDNMFTLSIQTQPANGTAVVVMGNKIEYTPNPGFEGDDPFIVEAADSQGGVGSATFTAQVNTVPPAPIANVMATDGTRLTDVRVTWDAGTALTSYEVFVGISATDPSPMLVGTVTAPTVLFDHTAAVPGEVRWYTVRGVNGTTPGPRSVADEGLRDTAPTGLSALGTTDFNQSVDLVTSVTDPDPGEVLVYSILAAPTNGTASIFNGKFRYVPNGTFLGVDTFPIQVTDRAGAIATGTATVNVICQDQTMTGITIVPNKIFASGGFRASVGYTSFGCPATFTGTATVFDGATQVSQVVLTGLASGSGIPLNFDLIAPPSVGTYQVEIRLRNDTTGTEVVRTASLPVDAFVMPAFTWSDSSAVATVQPVTLSMSKLAQCVATTDDAAARADTTLCLVTLNSAPAEITPQPTSPITFKGVPLTAGNYAAVARISQYDASGNSRTIGSASVPLTVIPASGLAFSAPTSATVKQGIERYMISPVQSAGPDCKLYEDLANAASVSASGKLACYVTWSASSADVMTTGAALVGRAFDLSPINVTWTVNAVRADSSLAAASSGSVVVTPTTAALSFNIVASPSSPTAMITPVALSVQQNGVDKCSAVTGDDSNARTSSAVPCLFEWGTVAGMTREAYLQQPSMKGRLPSSPTTVPYTVSVYFNGTKRTILSATQDIATVPPGPPVINFEYGREIAPDVFAVSVLGGTVGVVASETVMGDLSGSYLVSGGAATPFSLFGSKKRAVTVASATPLYTVRTMDVDLAYTALPSLNASKRITVVSVPRDGLRLSLINAPTTAPDTQPVQVTAGIQEMTSNGLAYVPDNAGAWMIEFGEVNISGAFIPMSSPIQTDANGQVTTTIDPTGKQVIRLAARATPVSGSTGYTTTMISRIQVVAVVKGTPVDGYIQAVGAADGPAPYLGVFRVFFTTRADQVANSNVTWYLSSDGGTTWVEQTQATSIQQAFRFNAGTYQVRVRFRNGNTAEESYSPPLTVTAYPVPKITLTGPTYLLPSNPGQIDGSAVDGLGSPMPGAVWSWELVRPVLGGTGTLIDSGTTLPIPVNPPGAGVYRLVVKARDPSSVASDTRAYGMSVLQVVVGVPAKPIVRISGPLRIETGKSASHTASVSTSFDLSTSNLSIAGEWTLPDGTIVAGPNLTWTPTAADFAISRTPPLTYTAWVVGYEVATRSSTTVTPQLWEYVWPTWRATTSLGSQFAPAGLKITIMPTDVSTLAVLEGLTYTWNVPGSIRLLSTPTSQLTAAVDFGGTHNVDVTVADGRGNSSLVSSAVTVGNPPALVVDLTAANLSKWSHAPITLGLAAKPSGGHPLDAVTSYTYWLDGVQLGVPSQASARLSMPTPGTYNVEVQVATRMGASATKSVSVVVPGNSPPVCNITGVIATNRRNVALKGNCTDADGQITTYKWRINGQDVTMGVAGNWTYMLPGGTDFPVSVDVEATDNGGLVATHSTVFN